MLVSLYYCPEPIYYFIFCEASFYSILLSSSLSSSLLYKYIFCVCTDTVCISYTVRFLVRIFSISEILVPDQTKSFPKQVLIRVIGADEHTYTNYTDAMQWLEDTNLLEMIVDKFSSSVSVLSDTFLLLSFITKWA